MHWIIRIDNYEPYIRLPDLHGRDNPADILPPLTRHNSKRGTEWAKKKIKKKNSRKALPQAFLRAWGPVVFILFYFSSILFYFSLKLSPQSRFRSWFAHHRRHSVTRVIGRHQSGFNAGNVRSC